VAGGPFAIGWGTDDPAGRSEQDPFQRIGEVGSLDAFVLTPSSGSVRNYYVL
jgi:hypothetical protein